MRTLKWVPLAALLFSVVATTAAAQAMPSEPSSPVASGSAPTRAGSEPTGIIMDSDFGHTWDDAAALAVANAADDRGDAKLLGVMINIPNSDAAGAVAAINTYYGNGQVPIGRLADYQQVYSSFLAKNYPHPGRYDQLALPDSAQLYRQILSQQPDHSVKIVSVGLLDNLAALLESGPDKYSSLTGAELVERKVQSLVFMGGTYPEGREYNFYAHPTPTAAVVHNWPTPMVYDGHEIGTRMNTGRGICAATPTRNPVAGLYDYLFGCGNQPGPNQLGGSFDVTAMYYAIYGTDGIFEYAGQGGSNQIARDGSNTWVMDGVRDQAYLVPLVSKEEIADKINSVLYYVPSNRH